MPVRAKRGTVYERHLDDDSGAQYFHNTKTGETQWDEPPADKPIEDLTSGDLDSIIATGGDDPHSLEAAAASAVQRHSQSEDGLGQHGGGSSIMTDLTSVGCDEQEGQALDDLLESK